MRLNLHPNKIAKYANEENVIQYALPFYKLSMECQSTQESKQKEESKE